MKSSDTPGDLPRSYLPRLVDPALRHEERQKEEKEEKFHPRYVDLPALRERGHGPRNLAWGVVTLLLALMLFALAVFFAGSKAAVSLGTCLLTFAALFVLARMHLFRQRNGGFLAVSIVCLLGALVALIERGFVAADALVKNQAVLAAAPVAARPGESEGPLLTQSFALPAPDPKKRQIKVLRDSRVVIGEKAFLIKAGDLFPLLEAKGSETTFAVRDLHVTLPSNTVEIVDPKPAEAKAASAPAPGAPEVKTAGSPAPSAPAAPAAPKVAALPAVSDELTQVTLAAQKAAIRRYPALGVEGSRENKLFVASYRQMKNTGEEEFFANPEWPIELAERLAQREGWPRDSQTMAAAPPIPDGASLPGRSAADPDSLPPDDAPSMLPKAGERGAR